MQPYYLALRVNKDWKNKTNKQDDVFRGKEITKPPTEKR